jgi:NitT/TauT family transport system substrate-binding protein
MGMKLSRSVIVAALLSLAWPVALAAAQGTKLETTKLTVGILPVAVHAPVFAAQELGYFAQEGLTVETQFGVGGAALLPLAIEGQLQLVNIPISTGLQARAQNLDIVMIGPGTYIEKSAPPGQTATIVKADSPIRQLKDLAGKSVAVNVINSVNWLYNRAMLDKAGADSKTVTYVELPFPNMVDAVANGNVAAAAIVQPFLYFGLSGGKVRAVGYDLLDVQPGVQVSGFATSRKWAKANPHTLVAFGRAVARAVDYLMASDAQAVPIIAKFTHTNPDVIRGTGIPSWSNKLSVENIDEQMALMVKYGLLKKPQDVHALIWQPAQP